jgi:molecular chaperone DnaK
LQQICSQLDLPQVRLFSEPVAASVYFAHCYQAKQGHTYHGHVLVCDYGGGTLDLSLCQVADRNVTILEGTGRGDVDQTLGRAGVAFDEAVVQRVLQRNHAEQPPRGFYRLLKEFEEQKIAQTEKLSKALERYARNPATNKKVFEIGDMAVEAADLAHTFAEFIQPELDRALQEMGDCLQQHNIQTEDGDHFHVVMVGGFSNFYLVRRTVRDFFNSRTEADSRFQAYFDLTDTALAIAKGAALIASEAFQIQIVCPISVGIRARDRFLEETDLLLLEKGTPLTAYQAPQFTPMWLRVMSEEALDTTPLTLFLDVGSQRRRYIDLRGRLRDFIPNPHPDNQWRVGFAVDENLLFTLHVADQAGEEQVTPLGNLEEKMSGLHFSEE